MEITRDEKIILEKILISEKDWSDINFEKLKKCVGLYKNI